MTILKHFSMKIPWVFVYSVLLCVTWSRGDNSENSGPLLPAAFQAKLRPQCPGFEPTIFEQRIPQGRYNATTMKYTKTDPAIETLEMCVQSCCEDRACNVAFMYEKDQSLTCFKLGCVHDSLCLPTLIPNATNTKAKRHTKMVLIRPFEHKAWSEVQITAQTKSDQGQSPGGTICEVGLDLEACQANEECVPLNEKSRNGACQCKAGFLRNNNGDCIKPGLPLAANVTTPSSNTAASSSTSTTQATPIQLTVQVTSKVVTLPDDSTILTAYAIPEAPTNRSYKYEWKLEKGNPGGTMENSHAAQLKLNHLVEGVYSFRVVVSGDDPPASGGALGNVTVLPAKRTNKPPTVVLQPSTQQINLPTSKAIIDASASVDDATPKDQLVFKWELKSEPLGYSKDLKETGPTLTLDDLIAGNYIIQVTVTDGDGAKSVVAEATIDVVPETDYPPTANAGEDIILYLPQREVTLYGNKSSDDHGISSWEWTRKTATGTEELAADTQNMRTPQATISNLEEGTYTFVLKVTDAKGQFSQDEVNVYVKAPTNLPPTANAGPDQEISLPKTWVILDGSASKDDVQVTKYNWTQISGPNQASFMTNNTGSANATGLTRGVYVFQLEVSDERNNTDQAQVTVTVNQDANSAPVADAGEDFAVTLPVNSVYLNGSLSKDDLKVTKWLWTRAPNSLAAGKIVGNTDVQPALLIADLVPGQYTFELQVWDEQGKSSSDSVTLTVKENPEKKNVVQAVFNADIASLTQTQLSNLIQGLGLLLHSSGQYKVKLLDIFPQQDSNYAVIHFIVVRSTTSINPVGSSPSASSSSSSALDLALDDAAVASGKKVVKELKSKLKADSGLLSFKFLSLDTLICQNECSGHGKCHQATRTCVCEPFWVENFVRTKLFDGESNCDWSVVYVGIFMAILICGMVCGICYLSCLKKRGQNVSQKLGLATRGARTRQRYSRLQQSEPGIELRNAHTSSIMISESDSEDEISFDSSPKILNGTTVRNGNTTKRNGFARSQNA